MRIPAPCLTTGIAYTVPVVVWLLATAAISLGNAEPVSPDSYQAMTALIGLQGLAIALVMPFVATTCEVRTSMAGALALLSVPLPAFAFIWLASDLSLIVIIKSQFLLYGAALVLIGVGRAMSLVQLGAEVRPYALVGLQLFAAIPVWMFREDGLRWLIQ